MVDGGRLPTDGHFYGRPAEVGTRVAVAEVLAKLGQPNLVLRPAWAGERGFDGRKVELEGFVEVGAGARLAPERVVLGVGLHEGDVSGRAAGLAQVGQRLIVNREEGSRRAVFGRHVRDRRAVSQRE